MEADKFVQTIDVPHVMLHRHISAIRNQTAISIDLIKGLVRLGVVDRDWPDLFDNLAADLMRGTSSTTLGRQNITHRSVGPDLSEGRVRVVLCHNVLLNGAEPINFEELRTLFVGKRKDYGRQASVKSRK